MSSIVVAGDTSGTVTLQAPAVAGSSVLTLPVATDTLVGKATTDTLTNKTLTSPTLTSPTLTSPIIAGTPSGVGTLTSATAQASTSGTSIDFTGIPSWVKRITVMFNGVSTNGASASRIQIGSASGGIEATGYTGTNTTLSGVGPQTSSFTAGFDFFEAGSATSVRAGVLRLCNVSGNVWLASGEIGLTDVSRFTALSGVKTLSAVLDRVRITTVNGTDLFDAGTINIMYE